MSPPTSCPAARDPGLPRLHWMLVVVMGGRGLGRCGLFPNQLVHDAPHFRRVCELPPPLGLVQQRSMEGTAPPFPGGPPFQGQGGAGTPGRHKAVNPPWQITESNLLLIPLTSAFPSKKKGNFLPWVVFITKVIRPCNQY